MIGELLHYGLDIFLTVSALAIFFFFWWKKGLDWSEKPSEALFLEDQDGL